MSGTALPDRYSLKQLYDDLVEPKGNLSQTLLILEQYLQHSDRIDREAVNSIHVQKLLSWLAIVIRPVGDILLYDNDKIVEGLISKSRTAFACIQHLQALFISHKAQVNPDALLSIIAYTDVEDPWTTEATQRTAEQILSYHQNQLVSHDFIIEHVLEGFIRPLFSDSRTSSVTSQGRRTIRQAIQKPHYSLDLEASKKPWKFEEVSAMTILGWAIRNLDEGMIHKNWHLCIPPLLTLLDDPATVVRVRGLHILIEMLGRIPSKVLQQTGLSEVFEDAIMPTLLFLPVLTPIEESLCLLTSAYSALLSLGEVRYPGKEKRINKMRFLNKIMRQGVLRGFIHSGDNVRIAELLIREVITLFDRMGIQAVTYLKDIIPLLSKILTDPFGPSHPSLLRAAAKATQTIVVNCWPRMIESVHRIELVKALTLCWAAVSEDVRARDEPRSLEIEGIKKELQLAGITLVRAVSGKLDMMEELQPLIDVDPSLRLLFGMDVNFK